MLFGTSQTSKGIPPGGPMEGREAAARMAQRSREVEALWRQRDLAADDYPSIAEFYAGRGVFITGASGFVGKVLVEKLLYECPAIGNLYLLLRPRRGQDPDDRLKALLKLPVFDRVRRENPSALAKLVAVQGDCGAEGLGLDAAQRRVLVDNVSVVFHTAASVRFSDPVKKAVMLNTRSARDIVQLAREMKKLKALVHMSTAYCFTDHRPTEECVYPTEHDWRDVLRYSQLPDVDALDLLGHKFLGFQPNTYVFSKALGERIMDEASQELPIVIVRPSIVTCALREPVLGWMDNLNGFAMFWAIASKGILRVIYSPNHAVGYDLVPVDTVSSATIAASWLKGTGQPLPVCGGNVEVVNITVGDVKPTNMNIMRTVMLEHLADKTVVYPGVVRYPVLILTDNKYVAFCLTIFYHVLFGMVLDRMLVALGRKPMVMDTYRKTAQALQATAYFQHTEFKFISDNYWRLQGKLHPADRDGFVFNDKTAGEDWFTITRHQLLGVLQYALEEPVPDMEQTSRHVNRLWWAEIISYIFLAAVGLALLAWRCA